MPHQNVNGATTKPTAASAQLTTSQIFELASYVEIYGIDTGDLLMPELPTECELFTASMEGSPDSITVGLLMDGRQRRVMSYTW